MEGLIEPKELYAVMVVGKQMPSKMYEDYNEAEMEATRLTEKERATVYVLKAVAKLTLTTVTITKL